MRLAGLGVGRLGGSAPADVVGGLIAVQAQDWAGCRWALGLRAPDLLDADVERAFADGEILRTHLLRPTWHLVTPADIGWLLALTGPRVQQVNAGVARRSGWDTTSLTAAMAAIGEALSGGVHLTRDELRQVLADAGITPEAGQWMAYVMMHAELEGIVCSGPRRGRRFTYALLDERAPNRRHLGREEALAELALRYFTTRGPATVHDMATWSGLTVTDVRSGLADVAAHLTSVTVDGRELWFDPARAADTPGAAPVAHLMSIFDEFISGYRDRSDIVAPEFAPHLTAMGNDLTGVVVIDGAVLGTWKRTLGRDAVTVTASPLSDWSVAEHQAVEEAAQRFGAFLAMPIVVETG